MIQLEIVDAISREPHVANLSFHEARKLYLALREVVGDVQYEAQPGELITTPNVILPANTG